MDKDTEKGKGTEEGKEKTYTQKEHDGIISDLQKERQGRQQSSFELSQSQSRLATLEKENKELKEKAEATKIKKSVIEGEDEDVVTVGEAKKIETKVMDSIEKAQAIVKTRDEKERLDANFKKSCTTARTKYADRKDVGLDWEPVYQAAIKRIGGRTKIQAQIKEADIYHSDDPGEELYQEGLKDPEIKAKLELAKNEKILDTMGDRKVDKRGLTGVTGSKNAEFFTPEEVSVMDADTARRNLPKVLKSAKHWEEQQNEK